MSDDVRVLMCPQCGAPADVPDAGGRIACEYCDGVLTVRPRMLEDVSIAAVELESLDPEAREAARMESLRRQAENYDENNPYSFYEAPPGYGYLSGINELEPNVATLAQQAFQAAVAACPERRGSIPQQRAVYWLSRKLKNIWSQRDEPLRARAVLHTAHETLSDPGFLHMLRTGLADMARNENDLEGARRWLARCDPRPPLLDLDTEYRTSLAVLEVEEGDWIAVLDAIGAPGQDIPYEPSSVAVVHSLRAEALERLGRGAEAEAELRWLIEDSPVPVDFLRTMIDRSPTYGGCREVWARLEASAGPSPAAFGATSGADDSLDFPTLVRAAAPRFDDDGDGPFGLEDSDPIPEPKPAFGRFAMGVMVASIIVVAFLIRLGFELAR